MTKREVIKKLYKDYSNKIINDLLWPAAAGNLIWVFAELAINFGNENFVAPDLGIISSLAVLFGLAVYSTMSFLRFNDSDGWKSFSSCMHIFFIISISHALIVSEVLAIWLIIGFFAWNFIDHMIVGDRGKETHEKSAILYMGVNLLGLCLCLIALCFECFSFEVFIPLSIFSSLVLWSGLRFSEVWTKLSTG